MRNSLLLGPLEQLFGANGGFGCTKEKRELIVKNYEKKKGFGLNGGLDFI